MAEEKNRTDLRTCLNELFLTHRGYVRYIALMNAPDTPSADDIVQDVYLAFIESPEKWDLGRDLRPVLRGITIRVAKKHWKKYLRTLPEHLVPLAERLQSNSSSQNPSLADVFENDELAALRVCMDRLTDRSRVLVFRHYFEGIPLVQIAEETGVNINTLYYQIDRVREVLKQCVENVVEMEVPDV